MVVIILIYCSDARFHAAESTRESEELLLEMQRLASIEDIQPGSVLAKMKMEDRIPRPKPYVHSNSFHSVLIELIKFNLKRECVL